MEYSVSGAEKEELNIHIKHAITKVMHDILEMKYYKNEPVYSGTSHYCAGHEDAIKQKLINNGFIKYTANTKSEPNLRQWETNPRILSHIPINSFIEQPFGTNGNPDFLVKINDNLIIAIEAKSCQLYTPVFNSCIPKSNYIYVFCSGKYNQTTIFMGYSVLDDFTIQLLEEHIAEARKKDEELNKKLLEYDSSHRGFSYYTRPMIQQSGTSDKTNYFTHKCRGSVEQEVFNFLDKKIIESNVNY